MFKEIGDEYKIFSLRGVSFRAELQQLKCASIFHALFTLALQLIPLLDRLGPAWLLASPIFFHRKIIVYCLEILVMSFLPLLGADVISYDLHQLK